MHQLIEAAESRVDSQGDAMLQAEAPAPPDAVPQTRAQSQAPAPIPASSPQEWIRRFGSSGPLRSTAPQARRAPAYVQMDAPEETPSSDRRQSSGDRELRATLADLEHLLRTMDPEDIERLLDYARRLARP